MVEPEISRSAKFKKARKAEAVPEEEPEGPGSCSHLHTGRSAPSYFLQACPKSVILGPGLKAPQNAPQLSLNLQSGSPGKDVDDAIAGRGTRCRLEDIPT